jgi:hypothetical protein
MSNPVPPSPIERRWHVTWARVPYSFTTTVTIGNDAIRCRPPLGRIGSEVVHRSRNLVMVYAWPRPPLWNHLLELVGEHGERVYITPNWGWSQSDLRDLEARGYSISVTRRWFF